MHRAAPFLIVATLVASALPGDARAQFDDPAIQRQLDAMRAAARARERQAHALEQLETLERDRARDADWARRASERNGRSVRQFDPH